MESISDTLKMRVLRLKSKIPHKIDYTTLYSHYFKEYEVRHLNRVRDVWNLRVADEAITMRLEAISEQYSKIKL